MGSSRVGIAAKMKQKARVALVERRKHRLKVITKFGGRQARKLAAQGVAPAALYGAPVTGVPCDLLMRVRRTAACATPPYAQGRSLDLALNLAGIDPAPNATGAPRAARTGP